MGNIDLAYETFGRSNDPPVVLVMGLGGQLHYWPEGLCEGLAERHLFVVRFDNRDVGLSTHLDAAGPVDLGALASAAEIPYTLSDLAADVAGLIAALGVGSAHVVGISLGGMIAQLTAIEHPERVRSLISISSTTGAPGVGAARPEAMAKLFTPPPEVTRDAIGAHALELSRVIGSPGFELDEPWLEQRAKVAFDRRYDPAGVSRQAATAALAHDRTAPLGAIDIPALIIHGSEDPLVDVSGGVATAAAIPDAELLIIDGMGHDLPRGAWPTIIDAVERTVHRAESDPLRPA